MYQPNLYQAAIERVYDWGSDRVAASSRFDSPDGVTAKHRLGRYGKAAGLFMIFTGGFADERSRLLMVQEAGG